MTGGAELRLRALPTEDSDLSERYPSLLAGPILGGGCSPFAGSSIRGIREIRGQNKEATI